MEVPHRKTDRTPQCHQGTTLMKTKQERMNLIRFVLENFKKVIRAKDI